MFLIRVTLTFETKTLRVAEIYSVWPYVLNAAHRSKKIRMNIHFNLFLHERWPRALHKKVSTKNFVLLDNWICRWISKVFRCLRNYWMNGNANNSINYTFIKFWYTSLNSHWFFSYICCTKIFNPVIAENFLNN